MAHANEAPPAASAVTPELPRAIDAVLAAGLAKRPNDRPASARELVGRLREALTEPEMRPAPTLVTPPARTSPTRVVRHGSRPRRGLPLLVAAGLLGAGGLLAWALTSLGDDEPTSTVVLTQTLQGETVVRTVTNEGQTVERTVTEEGSTATPPPADGGQSGAALNDQGFALLQQGDVMGALPLLEAAVADLSGDGTTAEAYASYNLATARFASGSCDDVLELLDRSEEVQGKRKEIDRLRKEAERRCEEGGGKGRGLSGRSSRPFLAAARGVPYRRAMPSARDFDLWPGTWDVRWGTNRAERGRNVVTRTFGGYVVEERFDGRPGSR